jgi:tRNA threonylcarbamoyladenosine biosynthesis protein TsaE
MQYVTQLANLVATQKFAAALAESIVPNFVVSLNGDLGAGKTTLVREILHRLGIVGSVKSPTYTLVEPYFINGLQIYHFDLYRFNDPDEWFESGFDEYFGNNCISFIEWADKARDYLPPIDWALTIVVANEVRHIEINPTTDKGRECLQQLTKVAAR